MPINAESREGAVKAAANLVPKGWYSGTIIKAVGSKYGQSSKNAGKSNLNVRVGIAKTTAGVGGRQLFVTVPLFSNWAPSAKYPDGYPTLYAPFFAALGVSNEAIDSGRIPLEVSDLGGMPLDFYVTENEADDFNDEDYNQIARFRKSTAGTPSAVREEAGDVWGTASSPTPAATESVWDTPNSALQKAADSGSGF